MPFDETRRLCCEQLERNTLELEKVLRERESVRPESDLKPETVLRLKNRIAEAKMAS